MNHLTLPDVHFKNPISYWLVNELAPRIPRKWKRMLYVTSIIALTSLSDKPNYLLFEKINEMLRLTYSPDDYLIPKFVRNMIWKKIIKEKIILNNKEILSTKLDNSLLTDQEIQELSSYLASKTPGWLVYAPSELLISDASKCLKAIFNDRFKTTERQYIHDEQTVAV